LAQRHFGVLIWAGIALAAAFIAFLVVTGSGDVKVGACMLPDVKPKITLVDCSDPVAGSRVVGKLDNPDEARSSSTAVSRPRRFGDMVEGPTMSWSK
jgi:hypothetical protein